MKFEKVYKNERDVEIPLLIKFVKDHPEIKTILDVGVRFATYINDLKSMGKEVYGVDIDDPGEEIKGKLKEFWLGDASKIKFGRTFDLVCSISSIEHYGIKNGHSSQDNPRAFLMRKLGQLSKKYIFFTFPYGFKGFEKNEFVNITEQTLKKFRRSFGGKFGLDCYYNDAPQMGLNWQKIPISKANKVTYRPKFGTRCVGILEGYK